MRARALTGDACTIRGAAGRGWRTAFTLVELLVTMVILAILASLMLAGLAGVRQQAKADKTRNTIRKIDAVIRPFYDSFRNRRVSLASPAADRRTAAVQLLQAKRSLVVYELPDCWEDVPMPAQLAASATGTSAIPMAYRTSPVRSYAATRSSSPNNLFGSAECLYMILARSGYEPDALEFFRPDEIGDLDKDGYAEFLDGWGRPIAFMRWAPGFTSPVQVHDAVKAHDPLDPIGLDPSAYALVPLIYSAGPDGALGTPSDDTTGYGLQTLTVGADGKAWLSSKRNLLDLCGTSNQVDGTFVGSAVPDNMSALDNITNHDLLRK